MDLTRRLDWSRNGVLMKNFIQRIDESTNLFFIEQNIYSGSQRVITDTEKGQFFVGKPVGKKFTEPVFIQLNY